MKTKKKFNLKKLYVFFLVFVLLIFISGISSYGDERQTETRYIYGTCVQGDGVLNFSDGWFYGTPSGNKFYSTPLSSGRSNTYWVLPKGYIYTINGGSITTDGGYSLSVPSSGSSLNPIFSDSVINAIDNDIYVIKLSKSGVCSSITFSYEYVISGDPDDPDNPDNPDDPDNPDNPDNPPISSENYTNELYEIRVLLACILCVNIINLFNRRIRDGYT